MGVACNRISKGGSRRLAYCAAIAAVVVMGSLGVFVRNISADATITAFARFAFGLAFLCGFLAATRNFNAVRGPISSSLVASGMSIGLSVWSYIAAIAHTSLANAAFLLYLGPLLAIGFAYLLLKETLGSRSVVLIGVAFVGCLLVLRFDASFSKADILGSLYGLLSAIGYALFIVSNRRISPTVSPLGRAFYELLIATLALAPFLVLAGQVTEPLLQDLPWLIAVGFLQGFLALTLMIFATRHLTTYEYGLLSYFEPVTAALIGVVVYAEPLTPLQALGGSLIVLSGIAQMQAASPRAPT